MTEEQALVVSKNPLENQDKPIKDQKKKEARWMHTILWVLSMMMIVNVVVGTIFYFLFIYKK